MTKFVFTCEHGGNKIPHEFKNLFESYHSLLKTHRAYDIGILKIFNSFAHHFQSHNFHSEISRLLIELNRSPHHKNLFSEITKQLDSETKQYIFNKYYLPYRTKVENDIKKEISNKHKVIHISFHSFTPMLNGIIRNADIGLLYDPKSKFEKDFCRQWCKEILRYDRSLTVRFNYPYLGIADGFTSYLRAKLGKNDYCGVELEINQKLLTNSKEIKIISEILKESFPIKFENQKNDEKLNL